MTDLFFSCTKETFIKPIFMESKMWCNSLFLLCKNIILSEKGAGMYNFKNGLSYDGCFENFKRVRDASS